jgi:hypothetical protein
MAVYGRQKVYNGTASNRKKQRCLPTVLQAEAALVEKEG